ncbi:MAG: glycosyltransferase family 2 protein [Deltaproteobacteria bacterium]|nr:glycosyltransferase family 2 protein [Deltaproteobacteria bacterium]
MRSISIVIPTFNEEESVDELYSRLAAVTAGLKDYLFEFIFVDDGSADGTVRKVKSINQRDGRVKLLSFSRNFGHQSALIAGLDHASGDAVIVMDADLQHPPELIPELIREWRAGYEVVNTIRRETVDAGWFKKASSAFFYMLINKLSQVKILPNSADFRLMDMKAVRSLCSIREQSRFIRGLVVWIGYRQTAVPYVAVQRFAGKSKYSLRKMVAFAFDGISSFSAFPLRVATYFGLLVSFLSFVYAIFAVYVKLFTDKAIAGWTSVLVVSLFLGGVQLLTIGCMGEYINRIYTEVKRRPLYIVRETAGIEKASDRQGLD